MSRLTRCFAALVVMAAVSCAPAPEPPALSGLPIVEPTTTTTSTTTTAVPTTTTTRPRPTTTAPPARMVAFSAGDRWEALAACESTGDADGHAPHRIDPNPPGYYLTAFQFGPDTAAKVGAYRGMPYPEAKAAAQRWAARPDINAASRAGWPTCWPKVMGDTPV